MKNIYKMLTSIITILIASVSIGITIPTKTANAGHSDFIVPLFSGYIEDTSKASITKHNTIIDMSKYNGAGGIEFDSGKITATSNYTISNAQAGATFCVPYNEKTGLYVMWVKVMTCASAGFAAIATSKSIKGPFTLVKKQYFPNGFEFGDYELVQHDDKAYCIYEKPHTELIITPLTEDYLGVEEDNYKSYFHYKFPPYVREAPASFVHNKKIYMITSGTTGKFPNPSEAAVADSYMGEWRVLGDPHINDPKKTSFDSQISCIFKPLKRKTYLSLWQIDGSLIFPKICPIFAIYLIVFLIPKESLLNWIWGL